MDLALAYVGGHGFWTGDAAAVRRHPRLISVVAGSHCQVLRPTRPDLKRLATCEPVSWAHVASLLASNVALRVNLIDALKRNEPLIPRRGHPEHVPRGGRP